MSGATAVLPKRKKGGLERNDYGWAAIMLAPNLIGFLLFIVGPVVVTLYLSFTEYDIITPAKFIGIDNYVTMFSDQVIGTTLRNTFVFTLITVPCTMVLALVLAVLLDRKVKLMRFFRAAYFLPSISSMVAVAVVWQWIYNPEFGLLNYILSWFGAAPKQWLSSSDTSLVSIAIVAIWKNAGYYMLLFLAGLQGISTTYYEASELEGANVFHQLWYITIPMLRPTTMFVFIMSIIQSFQVFDAVQIMTGGGPGRSSSVLVHYLYQNAFVYFRMGYACAIAYLLFFIVLIITIINMRQDKALREIF